MNPNDTLLQEIARALVIQLTIETPHIWRILPERYTHLKTLISKNAWINLSIDSNRLRVTSTRPNAMLWGATAESISCDPKRDPAQIAKDIYRRLLPNAREYFQKCREYSRKQKDHRAELAEKMHRLRPFFTYESTSHEKTHATMSSHRASIDLSNDKVNTLKIDSPTMEQTLYILRYLIGDKIKMTYDQWLKKLNRACLDEIGFSLYDLPDAPTREAYDEGLTPDDAFQNFCADHWEEYDPESAYYHPTSAHASDEPEPYTDAEGNL